MKDEVVRILRETKVPQCRLINRMDDKGESKYRYCAMGILWEELAVKQGLAHWERISYPIEGYWVIFESVNASPTMAWIRSAQVAVDKVPGLKRRIVSRGKATVRLSVAIQYLNDCTRLTFLEIANWIENNVPSEEN